MSIDTEIQAQVDGQLLEQGAYAPLEWLFSSGRLMYSEYEGWRRGEIAVLDTVLMGNLDSIRSELELAASYARGIGLIEQAQEFHSWTENGASGASKPLRISADPRVQRLIAGRFVPAQTAPQLDLFFDNPVVALTNGIVRALSANNAEEAKRQLDRLYVQAPNHADLAAFDQLVEALGHLGQSVENPEEESAYLLRVSPTARRLLGSQARDLLAPLWHQVATALRSAPFSPDRPDSHRSFALSQAQDWAAVRESVLGTPGWWEHAVLCRHLVESAIRLRRRIEALTAWCQLCWNAPDQANSAQALLGKSDLAAWWREFLDNDEGSLEIGDFAAWLLLFEPGLAWQLPLELPKGRSRPQEHYRYVHRWIHAQRARQLNEEISLRKALQASQPTLFRLLLTKNGKNL